VSTDERSPARRAALGAYGERVAVRALTDAGLQVLDRNWRCREGELDVVARDGDALVFCEVKTRSGTGYGTPAEAVTPAKRRRLRHLARAWLDTHDHHAPDLRFDVVGVEVPAAGPARVTHLRNAF
jgi:putative endonuclease